MSWLHYLIEANIYLGIFYLGYCVFLKNETYYMLSRGYLLLSCIISFMLPLMQLGILKPAEQVIQQQAVVMANAQPFRISRVMANMAEIKPYTLADGITDLYIAGLAIALIILFYRLYRLYRLIRQNKGVDAGRYQLVQLTGDNTAFSFFNYLL